MLAYCHIPVDKIFTTLAIITHQLWLKKNDSIKQLPSIPALKSTILLQAWIKKDRKIYILAGIRFVRYIE